MKLYQIHNFSNQDRSQGELGGAEHLHPQIHLAEPVQ